MSDQKTPPPAASELEILQLLWERGPLPVKAVHTVLSGQRPIVYTTVLKTMQVMLERGFLDREPAGRGHIYRAIVAREETQNGLLDTFLQRTFEGSAKSLVMRALGNYRTTRSELAELKSLLETLETEEE